MIVVLRTFQTEPASAGRLVDAAETLARQAVETEPGCRRIEVLSDRSDPGHVVLVATFDDEGTFREHCETEHARRFEDVAEALAHERTARDLTVHARTGE